MLYSVRTEFSLDDFRWIYWIQQILTKSKNGMATRDVAYLSIDIFPDEVVNTYFLLLSGSVSGFSVVHGKWYLLGDLLSITIDVSVGNAPTIFELCHKSLKSVNIPWKSFRVNSYGTGQIRIISSPRSEDTERTCPTALSHFTLVQKHHGLNVNLTSIIILSPIYKISKPQKQKSPLWYNNILPSSKILVCFYTFVMFEIQTYQLNKIQKDTSPFLFEGACMDSE